MSEDTPTGATDEAKATEKSDDGSVVVRLVTDLGEADITVPPRNKWRSMARNRLASNDDMGWAVLTLSREDAEAWVDLDPNADESSRFFEAFDKATPRRVLRTVGVGGAG
jgi:hypothetical protein